MKGYNKIHLRPYLEAEGFLKQRAIPLRRWDEQDSQGRERGKTPRDNNWTQRTYDMAEDVMPWISSGNNLGVRLTEEDVVLDFDPRNMEMSVEDAVASLEFAYGLPLSTAPTVITGSGGLHIYLSVPPQFRGVKLRNEIPEYKGVEFKSAGRQVVAAGSVHPSGGEYRWADGKVKLSKRPAITPDFVEATKRNSKSSDPTAAEDAISGEQLTTLLANLDATEFATNDDWITIMMACHDATAGSEEGMQAFAEWSASDPAYGDQSGEIRHRWESITPGGGVTIGTLLKHVRDAGGDTGVGGQAFEDISDEVGIDAMFDRTGAGAPKSTLRNTMLAVSDMGVTPRLNEMSNLVELEGDLDKVREQFPGLTQVWDDDTLHATKSAILFNYGFEAPLQMVREAVKSMALSNSYNPVQDYLNGLEWDGVSRIGNWLTTYAGVAPSEYTHFVSRVTMLAGVARAMVPGIKFDTMPILEGQQGCGKSTLVKILGGEYALEGLPSKDDLNSKDVIQAIQGFWMVEVEEMNAVRSGETASIKAFLSRQIDRARFAYATEAKNYPRRCVFIGTTNDQEYLADATGNRRFLPVSVGRVDLEGLQAVRDQLWAEALVLWKENPDPVVLQTPPELYEDASVQQEERRIEDPLEEQLGRVLGAHTGDEISLLDLMAQALGKAPGECSKTDRSRVVTALSRYSDQWDRKGRMLKRKGA